MTTRLAAAVLVSSLIRLAGQEGGAGYVLQKGDADAGAILITILEKGRIYGVFERILSLDGQYQWHAIMNQHIDNERELSERLSRRAQQDPDLWLIELNIANGERFVVSMPVGA